MESQTRSVPALPATGNRRTHQQLAGLQAESLGITLDRAQRYVSFAPFETADIRPVYAENGRESLLGESHRLPVPPKIGAQRSLEVPFHRDQPSGLLLERLHTYQ